MNKNLFSDMKVAWAEYEYICNHIQTKIRAIIEDTNPYQKDNKYINVTVGDCNVVVEVTDISLSCIKRIEDFLGVDAKVYTHKKTEVIKICFEDIE